MWKQQLRGSVEWALMVALIFGAGAIAQAQEEKAQAEGRIVQIGPADGQGATTEEAASVEATDSPVPEQAAQPLVKKYWIGLLGGPVTPELRYQLDIPEDQGVMVRDVVPESPAAEAGLKSFDIVLAANDKPVHDMRDLVELVRSEAEPPAPIVLDVLRHGQHETISITPAERPERIAGTGFGFGPEGWGGPQQGAARNMLRWFGQHPGGRDGEGRPFEFRTFGPGVVVGGQSFSMANMPNGVSVSIQRENDEPPQITVKRGDDVWNMEGDNPESLSQLPDDLRPFVDQLLHGGPQFGFNGPSIPMPPPMIPQLGDVPDLHGRDVNARLEAMEQQMRELQQQLPGSGEESPGDTQ